MVAEGLESSFPGLKAGRYRITSPSDPVYNCVAWAARDPERWWDPADESGYYWPPEIPRILSMITVVAVFSELGFTACDDDGLEPGFEKIAIYANEHDSPTHVARQLPSGAWTSKLGTAEDIEHDAVVALEGSLYGKTARVLRRRRTGNRPTT